MSDNDTLEEEVEELFLISFSQATQYDECPRKWAYQRVDKLEQPINFFSYFGSKVHKRIEEAIIAPQPEYDEITENALIYLQSLKPKKVEVEKHLEGEITDGIQVHGYADVVLERQDKTIVLDWKTKNKIPDYPSDQNLTQGNLYAHMTEADQFGIVYPQHDRAWILDVNKEEAKQAYEWVLNIGKDIVSSGAREIPGKEQRAKKNNFCYFCAYNARCHSDGGKESYQNAS